MIRNLAAYRRFCDQEERERLARLTPEETIAIGEALLTSELMDLARFPDDYHPMSLARALGIKTKPTST